jgi:outer membrane protein insertion porin family
MFYKPKVLTLIGPSILCCAAAASGQAAFGQSGALRFDEVRVVGNERMSGQEVLDLCDAGNKNSFDDVALQELVACLGKSGRFKDVALRTEGRALLIEVSEAPNYTGFLDIGTSLDTERGASVRLEVQDNDLFDRGIEGGVILDAAPEEQSASATLSNPDFQGRGWRAGVTLSYNNVNYDDQSFSYRSAALFAFLGVHLNGRQDLTFRAGLQADEMYEVALTASPILQAEAGKRNSPFLAIDYDAVFLPSGLPQSRFELHASQIFSGVGKDHFFSSTQIRAGAATIVVPDRLNISVSVEGGHIESNGGEGPRLMDRFQLGGESLRGFAPRGIGPADGGDQLGGTSYAAMSLETRSPLWTVGATQIEGGFFADLGSIWGLDDRVGFVNPVNDALEVRSSAGVSLTANIGSVPVTMYYAEPLHNAPDDKLQSFGLSLTTKF